MASARPRIGVSRAGRAAPAAGGGSAAPFLQGDENAPPGLGTPAGGSDLMDIDRRETQLGGPAEFGGGRAPAAHPAGPLAGLGNPQPNGGRVGNEGGGDAAALRADQARQQQRPPVARAEDAVQRNGAHPATVLGVCVDGLPLFRGKQGEARKRQCEAVTRAAAGHFSTASGAHFRRVQGKNFIAVTVREAVTAAKLGNDVEIVFEDDGVEATARFVNLTVNQNAACGVPGGLHSVRLTHLEGSWTKPLLAAYLKKMMRSFVDVETMRFANASSQFKSAVVLLQDRAEAEHLAQQGWLMARGNRFQVWAGTSIADRVSARKDRTARLHVLPNSTTDQDLYSELPEDEGIEHFWVERRRDGTPNKTALVVFRTVEAYKTALQRRAYCRISRGMSGSDGNICFITNTTTHKICAGCGAEDHPQYECPTPMNRVSRPSKRVQQAQQARAAAAAAAAQSVIQPVGQQQQPAAAAAPPKHPRARIVGFQYADAVAARPAAPQQLHLAPRPATQQQQRGRSVSRARGRSRTTTSARQQVEQKVDQAHNALLDAYEVALKDGDEVAANALRTTILTIMSLSRALGGDPQSNKRPDARSRSRARSAPRAVPARQQQQPVAAQQHPAAVQQHPAAVQRQQQQQQQQQQPPVVQLQRPQRTHYNLIALQQQQQQPTEQNEDAGPAKKRKRYDLRAEFSPQQQGTGTTPPNVRPPSANATNFGADLGNNRTPFAAAASSSSSANAANNNNSTTQATAAVTAPFPPQGMFDAATGLATTSNTPSSSASHE